DDGNGDRHHNLQPLSGADFVFKLSAPAVVVTGRHFDFVPEGLFCIGNATAGVASACIEEHRNLEQSVFAVDHGRPRHLTDVGHLPEWDLCPRATCHQHVCKILRIAPVLRCVTHAHGESPAPLDGCGDVVFTDGGFDHVLNRTHVNAVASSRLAVRLDVQ